MYIFFGIFRLISKSWGLKWYSNRNNKRRNLSIEIKSLINKIKENNKNININAINDVDSFKNKIKVLNLSEKRLKNYKSLIISNSSKNDSIKVLNLSEKRLKNNKSLILNKSKNDSLESNKILKNIKSYFTNKIEKTSKKTSIKKKTLSI